MAQTMSIPEMTCRAAEVGLCCGLRRLMLAVVEGNGGVAEWEASDYRMRRCSGEPRNKAAACKCNAVSAGPAEAPLVSTLMNAE
ncbi:unnamed protein product [Urochloa humidicola]